MATLYVVSTPIGNLEDVSFRALRVLSEVGLIAAEDTRVTRKLLSRYDIHTRLIPYHEHNKTYQSEAIFKALETVDVALVSDAGTPVLSDPGRDLIAMAIGMGVQVTAVPGPSAVTHAVTVSGLEPEPFLFLGFLPANHKQRRDKLGEVKGIQATLVLFEAPHRLKASLAELADALGDRRVAVCRELTKLHEQVVRTTLSQAADLVPDRGELTLVIEGAPPPRPPEADQAAERLRQLLGEGLSRKDAVERVSTELGLPRRQVYRLALTLAG
ncbi:MAG: 16S rRNA (cytidine(1402)-2'-O)-methyltransferase [Chloroflexota bacterium]